MLFLWRKKPARQRVSFFSNLFMAYCSGRTKYSEQLFLQKIKRVIQQHILEQKITFLALKVENSHVPKKLFLFL